MSLLVSHDFRFLLVGAHAAAVYGHTRNTEDIDFWLQRSPDNAIRVLAALTDFGFSGQGVQVSDLLGPNTVLPLGRAPIRIDPLTFLTGLDSEQSFSRREELQFEGLTIPVISLEDLLINKRATGRDKDLLDVAALSPPGTSG